MRTLNWKSLSLVFALLGATACGDAADAPGHTDGADAIDASFTVAPDGRADSLGLQISDAEITAVLHIANTYTLKELDEILDIRAARNIVEARQEQLIRNLDELDAVPWVGPAALRQLLEEASSDDFEIETDEFDARKFFGTTEIDGSFATQIRLEFYAELAESLAEQPFVENALNCNDSRQTCWFRHQFTTIRDYSDRADRGHIVASFRSAEIRNEFSRNAFKAMARGVINGRISGPLQCTEYRPRCAVVYGECTTEYRCNVRLPE